MWKKLISLTIALVLFLTSVPLAMAGSLVDAIMEEIEAIQKALDAGELTEEEALELLGLLGEEGKAALPTPENVRAVVASYNSVTLSWDAVAGAEYYNVHRSLNVAGPFTVIQSNVNATTYTDADSVVCGTTYYYRIVARNSMGDSSSFSAIVPVVVTPDVPNLLKAEVLSPTSAKLTWQEAKGASGYYIYRTVTGANTYQLIATITNPTTTTYTDTTLTTGVSYSYRMQSFIGSVASDYSNVLSVVALPATPANVKVRSAAYNKIIITWDKVEGATSYKLQRSADESGTGNYMDLGETTDTAYADTGLHPGVRYWYKVAAVVNGVLSDYSEPANDYPRPEAVTGVSATAISDTTVRLSWSLNLNAGYQGYWIEQWDPGTSTWTRPYPKIVGVNTTTYDIAGLTTGQIYYFRIVAYTLTSDSTWEVDGDPSGQVSVIPKPSVPQNLKVENAGLSSLKISWDRVATATGYEVYQSTSATGEFVMIADVPVSGEEREWHNAINLKAGTTYYYRVVAYVMPTPPTKVYSGYSGIASGMPAPLAPAFLTVTVTDYQSVYLNWAAVQGAEGYDILLATKPEGPYNVAATAAADATGYGLTGLAIGTTYYIAVRAFVTVNGVHVPGTPSDVQPVQLMPGTVIWDNTKTGPYSISVDHIGWVAVPGATAYEVEWSTDGSNFTLATTVTTNEAYITVPAGQTMYFRVRARVTSGGTNFYGDYSTVWGIEPKPTTPVIASATPHGLTDILVSWKTSADIVGLDGGYYVYFGTTPDISSMTQLAQLNRTDMNSYWHNGVTPGVNYYYAIRSYALTDYGLRTSDYSEVVGCYTRLAAPHDLVVFGNDASSFTLTWASGDDNATSFEIFSATSLNGSYTKVGETTGLQFTTPNQFAFGTVYYFKVRAKLTAGSVITYSDYSEIVAASPTLAAPTNVKVTVKTSTSVVVSWDAVKDANGYYVYMSTVPGGDATRVATVSNGNTLTATVSKLTVGQTYYFRVAAYHTWKKVQYEGARSSEVSVITSLVAPVAYGETKDKSSVVLTWTAVSGATSYRIYYRLYGTADPLQLLADGVTRTSYTVTNLPINVWYVFEIVPCTTLNGQVVEGMHSNSVVAFASLLAPKEIHVSHGEGTIAYVSWSRVQDASGYILEVSDKANADPYVTLLTMDSGDTLSATVDTSTLGFTTTAYFRVRAFYRDPSTMQVYPSGYTSAVAALDTVPDAPASFFVYQSGIGTAHLSWNTVANANGYFIFMKQATETSYSVVAQVGMINTYEVGGLSAGVQYNFAIRAFRTTGNNYTFGNYAHALPNPLMINANPQPLTAPTGLTVSQGANYSAVVKWNAVANATGYRVYMSKDGGPYDMVAETNKNTLTATIPNLQIGSAYNFYVSAFTTNASGSQEGPIQSAPFTIVIQGPSKLAAPNGLYVSQTGDHEAKVNWEAVSGAVGYYVFLSEKNANNFKVQGTTSGLTYDLKGLKVGTQYYVTVRAYTYYGGSTVYGDYPTPVSLMLSSGTLEVMSVDYIVSDDGKAFKITRPNVKGGTGNYTYTYYMWKSTGELAGSVTSSDAVVTLGPTPAMNGTYSVGVNVFDGYTNAVKQGDWLMLVGFSSGTLNMTLGAHTLSGDGQSMFIDKPTVTGGTGMKITYAYNLYDDAGHAINYFYSDENRVAMTPGQPGHYNVFVVATDTGSGEQVVKDIGWFDIT